MLQHIDLYYWFICLIWMRVISISQPMCIVSSVLSFGATDVQLWDAAKGSPTGDPQSASEIPSAQSSRSGCPSWPNRNYQGYETHTQMSLPHLPWKEKLQPPLPCTPTQSTLVCWPIPCVLEVLLTILATCMVGGQSEDPHLFQGSLLPPSCSVEA